MKEKPRSPWAEPETTTALAEATDDILSGYMDQLLQRSIVTDEVSTGTLVVDGEIQGWEPDLQPTPLAETVTLADPLPEPLTLPDSLPVQSDAVGIAETPDALIQERIDTWAYQGHDEFECLILRAGEYRLAIPMGSLGTIHTTDRPLSQVPGQAAFVRGAWHHQGQTYQVLDGLRLIMPERESAPVNEVPAFMLQLDTSGWLLACDELLDPITLSPDGVRWRARTQDRPWMAGILKEEMCVLLEVSGLLSLLGHEPGQVETPD